LVFPIGLDLAREGRELDDLDGRNSINSSQHILRQFRTWHRFLSPTLHVSHGNRARLHLRFAGNHRQRDAVRRRVAKLLPQRALIRVPSWATRARRAIPTLAADPRGSGFTLESGSVFLVGIKKSLLVFERLQPDVAEAHLAAVIL
jgi:hypothetical protein